MKKLLLCFSFLLLFVTSSFSAEPLVLGEGGKFPLKFIVDSLPAAIGKSVEIKMRYEWRYWSKSEFEQKQNAVGKIKYTIKFGKFCGGLHKYGGRGKYKVEEGGDLNFRASSYIDDKGNYGTGEGRLMVSIYCSYKGTDGKKHKGQIGGIRINVNFKAPR